jgi:integrase
VPNPEQTAYGTWRARWRDLDGRQRARTFKRKVDAERFLRDTRTDLDRGVYRAPAPRKLTVNRLADEWLDGAMNLRTGGRETYRRDLDRYILPALGDVAIGRLTAAGIDRFLADELAQGLAPSSVHRHYRTIRRMLQVAVDKGRLPTNPCDAVTPPRIPPSDMRFLTVEEVDALAGAITPRYRAWVYVAAYLGLRWSEGVGLQRSGVDGAKVLVAGQLVRRANGRWERAEPKTRAGRRAVTAPAFVADELATHLDAWAQPGPEGLVFVNQRDAPLGHSFGAGVFKPALRRAGLDQGVRIHDLRHTAVALAIAAGAHPKAIQARMGHASITVTLDRYGHLYPDVDEAVAAGLDVLARPPNRLSG